jgi:hypothetical protein
MKITSIVFLALIVFGCTDNKTVNQESQVVVIYGPKHVYSISIPSDWMIDYEIAKENRLGTFAYPKKYSNRKVSTFLHSTGYLKEDYKSRELQQFIQGEIDVIKKQEPQIKIAEQNEIDTFDGTKAIIYQLLHSGKDKAVIKNLEEIEYVAYINTPTVFCNIPFQTDNAEDLSQYLSCFYQAARTFKFWGEDINKVKEVIKQ